MQNKTLISFCLFCISLSTSFASNTNSITQKITPKTNMQQAQQIITVPAILKAKGNITSVIYNPNQVIELPIQIGMSCLIQLNKNETIEGLGAAASAGITKGWDLNIRNNNIFIKPSALGVNTDLILTTNQGRTYVFKLIISKKSSVYYLKFIYPNVIAKELASEQNLKLKKLEAGKTLTPKQIKAAKLKDQAIQKKEQKAELNQAISFSKIKNNYGFENYNYYEKGDTSISPEAVWSNGVFTYFKFNSSTPLPVIYSYNQETKQEALLNTNTVNNIVVVHSISSAYMLRYGKLVLEITTNENKVKPYSNLGTIISGYKRVIQA
ncbi:MAG: TrbG/VirB9 family P-type conjugative transfer protein [Psittacicella sp.]